MTKETIQGLINDMETYVTVTAIEQAIGMPKTTLQKVLKGERALPRRWVKPLEAYFRPNAGVSTKPAETKKEAAVEAKKRAEAKIENLPKNNYVIKKPKHYDYSDMPKGMTHFQQLVWKQKAREEQDKI